MNNDRMSRPVRVELADPRRPAPRLVRSFLLNHPSESTVSEAKIITSVEAGQVRRDPDPRTEGKRTVTVEKVDGRFAYVLSSASRRSRIATKALARWPLVTP